MGCTLNGINVEKAKLEGYFDELKIEDSRAEKAFKEGVSFTKYDAEYAATKILEKYLVDTFSENRTKETLNESVTGVTAAFFVRELKEHFPGTFNSISDVMSIRKEAIKAASGEVSEVKVQPKANQEEYTVAKTIEEQRDIEVLSEFLALDNTKHRSITSLNDVYTKYFSNTLLADHKQAFLDNFKETLYEEIFSDFFGDTNSFGEFTSDSNLLETIAGVKKKFGIKIQEFIQKNADYVTEAHTAVYTLHDPLSSYVRSNPSGGVIFTEKFLNTDTGKALIEKSGGSINVIEKNLYYEDLIKGNNTGYEEITQFFKSLKDKNFNSVANSLYLMDKIEVARSSTGILYKINRKDSGFDVNSESATDIYLYKQLSDKSNIHEDFSKVSHDDLIYNNRQNISSKSEAIEFAFSVVANAEFDKVLMTTFSSLSDDFVEHYRRGYSDKQVSFSDQESVRQKLLKESTRRLEWKNGKLVQNDKLPYLTASDFDVISRDLSKFRDDTKGMIEFIKKSGSSDSKSIHRDIYTSIYHRFFSEDPYSIQRYNSIQDLYTDLDGRVSLNYMKSHIKYNSKSENAYNSSTHLEDKYTSLISMLQSNVPADRADVKNGKLLITNALSVNPEETVTMLAHGDATSFVKSQFDSNAITRELVSNVSLAFARKFKIERNKIVIISEDNRMLEFNVVKNAPTENGEIGAQYKIISANLVGSSSNLDIENPAILRKYFKQFGIHNEFFKSSFAQALTDTLHKADVKWGKNSDNGWLGSTKYAGFLLNLAVQLTKYRTESSADIFSNAYILSKGLRDTLEPIIGSSAPKYITTDKGIIPSQTVASALSNITPLIEASRKSSEHLSHNSFLSRGGIHNIRTVYRGISTVGKHSRETSEMTIAEHSAYLLRDLFWGSLLNSKGNNSALIPGKPIGERNLQPATEVKNGTAIKQWNWKLIPRNSAGNYDPARLRQQWKFSNKVYFDAQKTLIFNSWLDAAAKLSLTKLHEKISSAYTLNQLDAILANESMKESWFTADMIKNNLPLVENLMYAKEGNTVRLAPSLLNKERLFTTEKELILLEYFRNSADLDGNLANTIRTVNDIEQNSSKLLGKDVDIINNQLKLSNVTDTTFLPDGKFTESATNLLYGVEGNKYLDSFIDTEQFVFKHTMRDNKIESKTFRPGVLRKINKLLYGSEYLGNSTDKLIDTMLEIYYFNVNGIGNEIHRAAAGPLEQYKISTENIKGKKALVRKVFSFDELNVDTVPTENTIESLRQILHNKEIAGTVSEKRATRIREILDIPFDSVDTIGYTGEVLKEKKTQFIKDKLSLLSSFDTNAIQRDSIINQVKRNTMQGTSGVHPVRQEALEPGFKLNDHEKVVTFSDPTDVISLLPSFELMTGFEIYNGMQFALPLWNIKMNNSLGNTESNFYTINSSVKDITLSVDKQGINSGEKKSTFIISPHMMKEGTPELQELVRHMMSDVDWGPTRVFIKPQESDIHIVSTRDWVMFGGSLGKVTIIKSDGTAITDYAINLINKSKTDAVLLDEIHNALTSGKITAKGTVVTVHNLYGLWAVLGGHSNTTAWETMSNILGYHTGVEYGNKTDLNLISHKFDNTHSPYKLRNAFISKLGLESEKKTGNRILVDQSIFKNPHSGGSLDSPIFISEFGIPKWYEMPNSGEIMILNATENVDTTLHSGSIPDNRKSAVKDTEKEASHALTRQAIGAAVFGSNNSARAIAIDNALSAITKVRHIQLYEELLSLEDFSDISTESLRGLRNKFRFGLVNPEEVTDKNLSVKLSSAYRKYAAEAVRRSLVATDATPGITNDLVALENIKSLSFDMSAIRNYVQKVISSDFRKLGINARVKGAITTLQASSDLLKLYSNNGVTGLTRKEYNSVNNTNNVSEVITLDNFKYLSGEDVIKYVKNGVVVIETLNTIETNLANELSKNGIKYTRTALLNTLLLNKGETYAAGLLQESAGKNLDYIRYKRVNKSGSVSYLENSDAYKAKQAVVSILNDKITEDNKAELLTGSDGTILKPLFLLAFKEFTKNSPEHSAAVTEVAQYEANKNNPLIVQTIIKFIKNNPELAKEFTLTQLKKEAETGGYVATPAEFITPSMHKTLMYLENTDTIASLIGIDNKFPEYRDLLMHNIVNTPEEAKALINGKLNLFSKGGIIAVFKSAPELALPFIESLTIPHEGVISNGDQLAATRLVDTSISVAYKIKGVDPLALRNELSLLNSDNRAQSLVAYPNIIKAFISESVSKLSVKNKSLLGDSENFFKTNITEAYNRNNMAVPGTVLSRAKFLDSYLSNLNKVKDSLKYIFTNRVGRDVVTKEVLPNMEGKFKKIGKTINFLENVVTYRENYPIETAMDIITDAVSRLRSTVNGYEKKIASRVWKLPIHSELNNILYNPRLEAIKESKDYITKAEELLNLLGDYNSDGDKVRIEQNLQDILHNVIDGYNVITDAVLQAPIQNYIKKRTEALANNFILTLDFFTTRIPTQGKPSSSAGRISQFYFEGENLIFASKLLTAIQGSDHDGDHQHSLTYAFNSNGEFIWWDKFTKDKSLNGELDTGVINDMIDKIESSNNTEQVKRKLKKELFKEFEEAAGNLLVHNLYESMLEPHNALEIAQTLSTEDASAAVKEKRLVNPGETFSIGKVANRLEIASEFNPTTDINFLKLALDGKKAIQMYASGTRVFASTLLAAAKESTLAIREGKNIEEIENLFTFKTIYDKSMHDRVTEQVRTAGIESFTLDPNAIQVFKYDENHNIIGVQQVKHVGNLSQVILGSTSVSKEGATVYKKLTELTREYNSTKDEIKKREIVTLQKDIIDNYSDSIDIFNKSSRPNKEVWEQLSQLISAAVDNVKELILGKLGANSHTNSLLATMVRAGVSISDAVGMLNELYEYKGGSLMHEVLSNDDIEARRLDSTHNYSSNLAKRLLQEYREIRKSTTGNPTKDYINNIIVRLARFAELDNDFSILVSMTSLINNMKVTANDKWAFVRKLSSYKKTNIDLRKFVKSALYETNNEYAAGIVNKIQDKVTTGVNPYRVLLYNRALLNYFDTLFESNTFTDSIYTTDAVISKILTKYVEEHKITYSDPQSYKELSDAFTEFGIKSYIKDNNIKVSIRNIYGLGGRQEYDLSVSKSTPTTNGVDKFIQDIVGYVQTAADFMPSSLLERLSISNSSIDRATMLPITKLKAVNPLIADPAQVTQYRVDLMNLKNGINTLKGETEAETQYRKEFGKELYDMLYYYSLIVNKGTFGGNTLTALFDGSDLRGYSEYLLKNAKELATKFELNLENVKLLGNGLVKKESTNIKNEKVPNNSNNTITQEELLGIEGNENIMQDNAEYEGDLQGQNNAAEGIVEEPFYGKELDNVVDIGALENKHAYARSNSGVYDDMFISEELKLLFKFNKHIGMYVPIIPEIPSIALPMVIDPNSHDLGVIEGFPMDSKKEHISLLGFIDNGTKIHLRKHNQDINTFTNVDRAKKLLDKSNGETIYLLKRRPKGEIDILGKDTKNNESSKIRYDVVTLEMLNNIINENGADIIISGKKIGRAAHITDERSRLHLALKKSGGEYKVFQVESRYVLNQDSYSPAPGFMKTMRAVNATFNKLSMADTVNKYYNIVRDAYIEAIASKDTRGVGIKTALDLKKASKKRFDGGKLEREVLAAVDPLLPDPANINALDKINVLNRVAESGDILAEFGGTIREKLNSEFGLKIPKTISSDQLIRDFGTYTENGETKGLLLTVTTKSKEVKTFKMDNLKGSLGSTSVEHSMYTDFQKHLISTNNAVTYGELRDVLYNLGAKDAEKLVNISIQDRLNSAGNIYKMYINGETTIIQKDLISAKVINNIALVENIRNISKIKSESMVKFGDVINKYHIHSIGDSFYIYEILKENGLVDSEFNLVSNEKVDTEKDIESIIKNYYSGRIKYQLDYVSEGNKEIITRRGRDETVNFVANRIQSLFGENAEVKLFTTEQIAKHLGKSIKEASSIKGFNDGDLIVLNKDSFNESTPFHEMTHIYMRSLRYEDPVLYSKLLNEAKNTELFKSMEKIYSKLTSNEVAEEVISEFVGNKSAYKEDINNYNTVIDMLSTENSLLGKVKSWFRTFIEYIFGTKVNKDPEINNTLKEFVEKFSNELLYSEESLVDKLSDVTKKLVKASLSKTVDRDYAVELLKESGFIREIC